MASTEKRTTVAGAVRYRAKYLDPEGRKKAGPWVKSKREALKFGQDEEAKIRDGSWHDASKGRVTLSSYFEEHWLPHRRYELNTTRFYQQMFNAGMRDSLGDMELRRITRPIVERWVTAMLTESISTRTVHARFKALQTILAGEHGVSAVRDGLIKDNPCQGVDLPPADEREVKVYSVDESARLCDALGAWWAPLPLLAAETGLRWGELLGLTVASFQLGEKPQVIVARTIIEVSKDDTNNGSSFMWKERPKGRRARLIALSPDAALLVRGLIRERRLFSESDRLFTPPSTKNDGLTLRTDEWPEGRPIFRRNFRDLWLRAHDETGIERNGRSFHSLRGSHLTWLLAGGADLATVMDRAGHRDIATTQVYLAALADADTRALDALANTKARYAG